MGGLDIKLKSALDTIDKTLAHERIVLSAYFMRSHHHNKSCGSHNENMTYKKNRVYLIKSAASGQTSLLFLRLITAQCNLPSQPAASISLTGRNLESNIAKAPV